MLNGVAAVAVGVYLLMVLYSLNHNQLASLLGQESGFLKWGAAIMILTYIGERSPAQISPIVTGLIGVALMAMVVGRDGVAIKNIESEIERIF